MNTLTGSFTPTLMRRAGILIKGGARKAALTSITVPNYSLYGGATITRSIDGANNVYVCCCAKKNSTGVFGFYCFKNGVEVPITPFSTGRGSANNSGWWIAWTDNNVYNEGQIPGFQGYPDQSARIAALEARIAALEARAPVPGPAGPQGPQGVPGPQGPAGADGSGGGSDELRALLRTWLGIS